VATLDRAAELKAHTRPLPFGLFGSIALATCHRRTGSGKATAKIGTFRCCELSSCVPVSLQGRVHLQDERVLEEADETAFWLELMG